MVLGIALAVAYRRTPAVAQVPPASMGARLSWAAIAGAGLLGAVQGLHLVRALHLPRYVLAVEVLSGAVSLAAVAAGTLAAVWHIQRLAPRPSP
jgi:hypothetical protein